VLHITNGELVHIELNGFDRWLGGMHLSSPDAIWRWDGSRLIQ
jgi:hypothetical protein